MEAENFQIEIDKLIFFLGGYDAEMVTIREILEEHKIPFFDQKLHWGAKLSAYKEELSKLSQEQIPVFIELNLDIDYPSNAIVVDHHNQRAGKDKKTSIEQVAEILGIILNRKQQIISANDSGYIWSMIDFGANEVEIEETREYDKKCQGVIAEDEEKAKLSIEHYLERISNDTVIIYSCSEITTPITDLIYKYYRHIFIISPSDKFSYSGNKQIIDLLKQHYEQLYLGNKKIETWSGGYLPEHGYFGANKSLKKEAIVKIMEPFIEKERIYSQHIFMFPFNIVHDNIKKCTASIDRLIAIHEIIKKSNSGWKYKPFKILQSPIKYQNDNGEIIERKVYSPNEIWAYNEYEYFHEYVRDTLFNQIAEKELFMKEDGKQIHGGKNRQEKEEEQPVSLYYERDVRPTDEMIIFVRARIDDIDKIIKYSLRVEHLSLRIFETGIGILSITLYNTCNSDIDSILRINDFGRRIYPQFLGEQNQFSPDPTDAVKNSFLPDKITFKAGGIVTNDSFESNDYLSGEKHFAKYLEELLKPFQDSSKNKLAITPIIDDRMFVVCWHENDVIMNKLNIQVGDGYNYETSDDWYKYVFIDSGKYPLVQHKAFKKQLILSSTYQRFTEFGTLYGVTRYSLVCLCSIDKYNDFPYRIIRNHMQKVYYQMSMILLAQRASIIKFNRELEIISQDADRLISNDTTQKSKKDSPKIDLEKILSRAERLNKDIILFSNRIWFDEVSPQDQGIELYKLALKNMDIEYQYNSLRTKVNQLYDFIRIRLEHQKTTNIQKLTVISLIFAALICILTFWAIDFSFLKYWKGLKNEYEFGRMIRSWVMFLSTAVVLVSSTLLWFNLREYIALKKKKNFVIWLLIISLTISLYIIL